MKRFIIASKINDIYSSSDYEIRLKAPILLFITIPVFLAFVYSVVNDIINHTIIDIFTDGSIVLACIIAVFLLYKGWYNAATNLLAFTVMISISILHFTNPYNGDVLFGTNTLIYIIILLGAGLFLQNKRLLLVLGGIIVIDIGILIFKYVSYNTGHGIQYDVLKDANTVILAMPVSIVIIFFIRHIFDKVTANLRTQLDRAADQNRRINSLVRDLNRLSSNILEKNVKLSESESKYSAIFNSSFIAIFLHDRNGKILDVNQTMLTMYGLESKEEALGYDIRLDYSSEKNDIGSLDKIWEAVAGGEERFLKWIARRPKDGTTFRVEVTFRAIKLVKGAFILANVMDVSERHRIEEQLIQAQKMEAIGTIAGGLAHDFNNILGGITGAVSLLKIRTGKGDFIDHETLVEYLDMINEASFRAANIVNKLLSLSKKQEYNFSVLDLNEVLRHVAAIAENTFDKSIEMHIDYFPEPAYVRGDPTQLEQVLLNLFVNAAHAMTIMRGGSDL